MKLEILKDNKNTQARVGTIMTVQQKAGKDWVKKGWAIDLSNPLPDPDPEADEVEEFEIMISDDSTDEFEPSQS